MSKEMDWGGILRSDPTGWLLEEDRANPAVRYMTLRDLYVLTQDDSALEKAAQAVMNSGPVPVILDAQDDGGFWVNSGPGYNPKYRSTVWSLIALAQLGASPDDPRVRRGCEYYLEHATSKEGAFTMSGSLSGSIYCLTGNLIAALIDLGLYNDSRLSTVLEWLVRATIGQGSRQLDKPNTPPFYLKSGVSGPNFECSANNRLPCAWGGLKVMRALVRIPERDRTTEINQALKAGTDFFFSRDPADADYPMGWSEKPNRSWWKFGYPNFYISDMLEILEVLSALGFAADTRLDNAFQLLLEKQDSQGRWPLEYTYNGKTWVDVEEKGKPSKWVTLRALRVIRARTEGANGS
ncbi:MAG: nitrogen fixation protein NifH [Chloroflexota bacterium]|nr:nitrogen fixation protein NifH [Chloroflexota bacterium]